MAGFSDQPRAGTARASDRVAGGFAPVLAAHVKCEGVDQASDKTVSSKLLSAHGTNDLRLHCGLGETTTVDSIEVHWPSGTIERLTLPVVDRFYSIEEGRGVVPGALDSKPATILSPDRRPQ